MNKSNYIKNCLCVFYFFVFTPLIGQGVLDEKQSPAEGYEYIAYLPEGYEQNMEEYPVLVYLHGGDGVGNIQEFVNFDKFRYGVPVLINNKLGRGGRGLSKYSWDNSDLIVVVPHLPCTKFDKNGKCNQNNNLWNIDSLHNTVLHLKKRFRADVNKVYFSGISLGAKGVWDYSMAYPDVPAAIVPISGNAMPDELCNIKDIPVWAFHGDIDGQVEPDGINSQGRSGTYILVDVLNNCPGKTYTAKLTKMLFKGHDPDGSAWDPILDLSSGYDIYEWMLRHTKEQHDNVAPVVSINQSDQRYSWGGEPMVMKFSLEAFDSNGDLLAFSWTLSEGDAESVEFLSSPYDDELFVKFNSAGSYKLQVEVTDGVLLSYSYVTIELSTALDDIAIAAFQLFNKDTDEYIREILSGDKIDTDEIGTKNINVKAIPTNGGVATVRFSLGQNRNFRTLNDGESNGGNYFISSNGLMIDDGEYIITATPFNGKNPARNPGISDHIVFYVNVEPPAVLPVEFLSIKAQQQIGGEVIVSWSTASEKNNDYFTIERSAPSTDHFEPIGTEKGKGDSHSISYYKFIDHNPQHGANYYRIKQTDFDGKSDYSTVVSVHIVQDPFEAVLFPNPIVNGSAQLHIATSDLYKPVKVQVMDALGNVIHEAANNLQDFMPQDGGYLMNMDHQFKPGVYFVNVSQGPHIAQKKFIAY